MGQNCIHTRTLATRLSRCQRLVQPNVIVHGLGALGGYSRSSGNESKRAQVADAVYDASYNGTGNWAFNTAFAGSFGGMRSYVTRFDDLAEAEDWIAAGIPVILSARWDWLRQGRPLDSAGHLIVCIGFTETGDVIINDPAAHLDRGQSVRQIYKREDVLRSWSWSHHTVYLVYPTTAKLPANRYGHW